MKYILSLTAAALFLCSIANAQNGQRPPGPPSCSAPGTDNAFLGIKTVRIWPGDAPMSKGSACDDIPTLTEMAAQPGADTGSAVIVIPGGAYAILAGDIEGRQVADWFAVRGFHTFVLSHRLSSHGYLFPVPLLDAQRAIQYVRAHAKDYHISPDRIVVAGFSAGGHLAALAATKPVPGDPKATDPVEQVSSRPDYLVLGYAWLGAITTDYSHLSYCNLFKIADEQCNAFKAEYTPAQLVSKDTPPTFIFHTFTDTVVPVQQTVDFYQALVKNNVSTELHIFGKGGHGSGLGRGDVMLDQWPSLLETWIRSEGLMERDEKAVGPLRIPTQAGGANRPGGAPPRQNAPATPPAAPPQQ
jgi:acetyl esterase/lipase